MLATITELNDVVDALQVRAEAFNAKLQALWGVCWKQIVRFLSRNEVLVAQKVLIVFAIVNAIGGSTTRATSSSSTATTRERESPSPSALTGAFACKR